MIVTNENILKDIRENLMTRVDAVHPETVNDMMLYMRDIYEKKVSELEKENTILSSALKAVNKPKESEPDICETEVPNFDSYILDVDAFIKYIDTATEENDEDENLESDGIYLATYNTNEKG